jgi:uncharacterized membrane protein YeiH
MATTALVVLDLVGTFAFALNGALTALRATRLDIVGMVTLGMITGVGGGTIRDVLIRQVPSVLSSGLYAVPALVGATTVVVADLLDIRGPVAAVGAAALCFAIRMIGVHYDVDAPLPPGSRRQEEE